MQKSNESLSELRKRAEDWIHGHGRHASTAMSMEEGSRLIHELYTYQVELELQNEDLRFTQAELEQSRRRYNDLYDFAPVGYLTVGGEGLILESNLTAAEMLGVERQRLLQRSISSCIHPEDQAAFYYFCKRLETTSRQQTCEVRLRQFDASDLHVLLESRMNPDIDGIAGEFRITLTDISAFKKLEDSLAQSKNEWEKTFDSISDLITIQDENMRIVKANKATHEMFGAGPGQLKGRRCHEVFQGSGSPCLGCPELYPLKDAKTQSATITVDKLGKIFEVSCSPLLSDNGEGRYVVHVARDITVQKRIEEELLQTQKMEAIGTLAGGIAHDFNNILTAVLGYADILQSNSSLSPESHNHIEQIVTAGNRARELVKQILTFSRKGQGSNYPMDLAPVILEALKLMRASLPATVEIREEIHADCGSVLTNPINIHQVLVNLCTNALHAMEDERGVLGVTLTRAEELRSDLTDVPGVPEGPFVELSVSDTGSGIDKETLKRIFEPYYTTKEFGKGSGVGLAVVHGIVRRCGGLITVESEPELGSTFHVYFPVADERAIAGDTHQEEDIPTGDERVVVVDDEEPIAMMYQMVLEQLGYQVTAFTDSEKVLQYCSSFPNSFDLVVSDQTMPRLSGTELLKRILEIRPDVPSILCTGHSSMVSEKDASAYGIGCFFMKPVSRVELARAVRELLDNKKGNSE